MSVIVISVDGTPVTDDVIIAGASFISLVNGSPGQCGFQVRDDAHTYSFLAGQSITMTIDGTVYWGGYVMRARYTYPLSVMDTTITPVTVARYWSIEGVDYNILFQKRVVFNPAAPISKLDFPYPVDTYDDTIINDIFDHYLDISTDGLTRTGVTRIDKAFLDIAGVTHTIGGNVGTVGMTWGESMALIAKATGGVYYITPDKVLHYVDAGTVTSTYTLTDRPYPTSGGPSLPVFSDTFSRTVARGLGGDWTWSDDDSRSHSALTENAYVDGSAAILPATPQAPLTAPNYESFRGIPNLTEGTVQFDFWVPPLAGQNSQRPVYGIWFDVPVNPIYVYADNALGSWRIGTDGNANEADASFSPTPSSWYTAQMRFDALHNLEYRVWPQGDPEPADPILALTPATGLDGAPWYSGEAFLDFYYGAIVPYDAKVDNVKIWDVTNPNVGGGYTPPADAIGYQKFSVVEDGSNLVNDMLVWGSGLGSEHYVFSRTEDATSITDHNRWQSSIDTAGLYRQATADIVADSYVYGTPQSLRGGKDDAVSFICRVFEPVFQVGEVVPIICDIFGFTRSLPIRRMQTTFANPTSPVFDLLLSNAIDLPVGIFEQTPFQAYKPPRYKPPKPWKPGPWSPPPPPCDDATCGITDTFTRTVAAFDGSYYQQPNGWGRSEYGNDWEGSCVATAVNGSEGVLAIYSNHPDWGDGAPAWVAPGFGAGNVWGQQSYLDFPETVPMDITWEIQLNRALAGDDTGHSASDNYWGEYFWLFFGDNSSTGKFVVEFSGSHHAMQVFLASDDGQTGWVDWGSLDMTQPFKVRVTGAGAGQPYNVYVWNSSGAQPLTPTLWITGTTWSNHSMTIELSTNNQAVSNGPLELHVLSVDVVGVNRCTAVQFDDFNRTVASGWGTATPSGAVWSLTSPGNVQFSVDGSSGKAVFPQSAASLAPFKPLSLASGPWSSGVFTMTTMFSLTLSTAVLLYEVIVEDTVSGDFVEVLVGPYNGTLNIQNLVGAIYQDVSTAFSFGNVTYLLKWEVSPTETRAKVWATTATEPDWMVTAASAVFAPNKFSVTPQGRYHTTGGNGTLAIDSIEFDYAGKPCYMDCGGITDTFTRTVSGGWGTSDGGIVWDTEATAYVNGTQGCLIVASSGSSYRCGVSLAYPEAWPLDVTVLAAFNRSPANTSLPVSFFDSGNSGEGLSLWPGSGSQPYIAVCHVSGVPTLVVNNQSDTQVAAVSLGFSITSPFYVNWALTSGTGTLEVRAWAASTAKPSSPTASVSVTSLAAASFDARLWAADIPATDIIVYLDSLDITGVPSCAPVAPAAGVPPAGYVCETIMNAVGTHFHTTHLFAAMSLEVYINSLRQFGNYTYDGTTKTFDLDSPVVADDHLRVCYTAVSRSLYGSPS